MRCEDCKNYEPKSSGKLQDFAGLLVRMFEVFCSETPCVSCPFRIDSCSCHWNKIKACLRAKGVYA